jgi:hypothetical protein
MLVFTSVSNAYPEMMIKRLPSFAMESYADPVIAAAAKVLPGTILTYATSTSALSTAVRRNKDPLVKSIVRIANESKAPLKALPFLEEVNSGRKTVAEIDVITADPKAYAGKIGIGPGHRSGAGNKGITVCTRGKRTARRTRACPL